MTALRLVLINTMGATAPEFVCTALSKHPDAVVLPGLSPVRDRAVLYRGHDLTGLDARQAFDALWRSSYEPSGRMWAGVLRDAEPAERDSIDLEEARRLFALAWHPGQSYASCILAFVRSAAVLVGADKKGARVGAIGGAPFLRILEAKEILATDTKVLDCQVPLPIWLALAGSRGVVNCHDALHTWIIGRLQVELARQMGVCVFGVDALHAAANGVLPKDALNFLDLDSQAPVGPAGRWQRIFDPRVFSETESLAHDIKDMFRGDPLFDAAEDIETWIKRAAQAPTVRELLADYDLYWRGTAHVHFDTCGPLEKAVVAAALNAVGQDSLCDTRDFRARFAQAFYHEWIRFRSYSFERPALDLDVSLGPMEKLLPLPRAGYFAFAAVAYLERCVDSQSKWFDSYCSVTQSDLFQRLVDPNYASILDRHGLTARLQALARKDADTGLCAQAKFGG
jgi:hypothetical protein